MNSKIDFVEGFIILSLNAFAEVIEFFFGMTGVGIFVSFFISFTVSCINGVYLFLFKGTTGRNQWVTYGVGVGSDILTGGVLPTRTISLGINIILHNRRVEKENEGEVGEIQPNQPMAADNYYNDDEQEQRAEAAQL